MITPSLAETRLYMVNLLTGCTQSVTVRSSTSSRRKRENALLPTDSASSRNGGVDQRISGVEGEMGTCSYCGTTFPKTRSTRKYCTNRCKTNACLDKKPRLRAADVEAIHEILHAEFRSVEAMRERLRAILAPEMPPVPLVDGRAAIPRLD
jgi:hypothetical protein